MNIKQLWYRTIIPILIFVIPISIFILGVWLLSDEPEPCISYFESKEISSTNELFVASPGFSGDTDGLTIYFNDESIVNNRIKVLLNGEVRWIRLEGR